MADGQSKHIPFPKISGKYQDFLSGLRKLQYAGILPQVLEIEGTVKLHGAHADIVYDLRDHSNPVLTFQSRNRVLAHDEDCHGWPCEITRIPSSNNAFEYLKNKILSRFKQINPGVVVDSDEPLVVAGEWIGGNVQQGVGIAQLTKRFVILGIRINGGWQNGEDYADIEAARAGIYSVYRAKQVKLCMDTRNLTGSNTILLEMQRLADVVELHCPFAASFGVLNARGEGVVWKPGILEARANPRYWLKTKGPISGPENRIDLASILRDQHESMTLDALCSQWLTCRRVEQGFEYLNEMKIEPVLKSVVEYRKWMVKDIVAEEKAKIKELQSVGVIESVKSVKSRIEKMATDAYFCEAERCGTQLTWKSLFYVDGTAGEPRSSLDIEA